MVQLGHVVPHEVMFSEYIYLSGTSNTLRGHFAELAAEAAQKYHLNNKSFVIDIGSNDGTLLKCFQRIGAKTLGFEPATNIAKLATADGVDTINKFFGKTVAEEISRGLKADAIFATNVFAHVDDLGSFLQGVRTLLKDTGVFVIEVPYLVDILKKMLFDTIYHEHLSYFSLGPLVRLFTQFGMKVVDVKQVDTHGGSIRVHTAGSGSKLQPARCVEDFLQQERKLRLDSLEPYQEFSARIEVIKRRLVEMMNTLKANGRTVVGYGAPAKGNTLLNYCNIGKNSLDYIVDENRLKQNMYTPGTHIPILPTRAIQDSRPDYALLLAWNYATEIFEKERAYREEGGKFIIPIPEPRII
jgi:SAM-dependent methyltransferase